MDWRSFLFTRNVAKCIFFKENVHAVKLYELEWVLLYRNPVNKILQHSRCTMLEMFVFTSIGT